MNVIDCEQGTPTWKAARAGKVTASCIVDVMAKIKTGEAAARRDYKAQLVAEIMTGSPADDGYTNAAMQWGTEQEPYARAAYELRQGVMVDTVGFVLHPRIESAGASPDGIVGEGLLELKCPKTATHINYVLGGDVPAQYKPQMLWQMACCESPWCDFASYDPRMPEHLQLFVVRFHRDDAAIEAIEAEVLQFNSEVQEIVSKLRGKHE